MSIKKKGSCHCGLVQYELTLEKDFTECIDCNCSICQRKGTLLAFVPMTQFQLISGADSLTDYLFNKKRIHHKFCKVCGVTSFASAQMPDGEVAAVNVRCIEGIDLSKLKINSYDGKSSN